jgi:Family of unknown function (DUF6194)
MITVEYISDYLLRTFDGVRPKQSWGEKSFFYNPDGSRPHGTYFFTIKEKNGDHDKASELDRSGIYRLNFGVSKDSFLSLFTEIPERPAKGMTITGNYDFTARNVLTPHPIYGWMRWLAIVNPDADQFEKIKPYITESYHLAVAKFNQK